jgi:hypothetical protein
MTAPFAAITMLGMFVLVDVTAGMMDGIDHGQLLQSAHPQLIVDDGQWMLAHHAGAAGMKAGAATTRA